MLAGFHLTVGESAPAGVVLEDIVGQQLVWAHLPEDAFVGLVSGLVPELARYLATGEATAVAPQRHLPWWQKDADDGGVTLCIHVDEVGLKDNQPAAYGGLAVGTT